MITVEEALATVLEHTIQSTSVSCSLTAATGKVLQEDIYADRDFPPFDRVMMDGIGIEYASWEAGRRSFTICGVQLAGSPRRTLEDTETCLEVMTGAMLPERVDTIIPYEEVDIKEGIATISNDKIQRGKHIHPQGHDRKKAAKLLSRGTLIGPAEAALLATVGKKELLVSSMPKVALISTGDELVEVDEVPLPYQIRMSNSYALQSSLTGMGIEAQRFHLLDNKDILLAELTEIIASHDVLILSGGVSKGKKDHVPEVLAELGVEKRFHRVRQRPGKPFWFGTFGQDKAIFALPGNPASTFLCYYRYVLPWLWTSMGAVYRPLVAVLEQDFSFQKPLTCFLQVSLYLGEDGRLWARPKPGAGSGDLANLTENHGFLQLPAEKDTFRVGEVYPLVSYRPLPWS